ALGNTHAPGAYATNATATIDTVRPVVRSLACFDVDGNGKIDTVVATFDEAIAASASTAGWSLSNPPSGATLNAVSTNGASVTLALTEGAAAPTTAVGAFAIALDASTSLVKDSAGNVASFAGRAPTDLAPPAVVSVTDLAGAAHHTPGLAEPGDTFDITFSEPVSAPSPSNVLASLTRPSPSAQTRLWIPGVSEPVFLGVSDYFLAKKGNDLETDFAGSTVTRLNGNTTVRLTLGPTVSGDVMAVSAGGVVQVSPVGTLVDADGNQAAGRFRTTAPVVML